MDENQGTVFWLTGLSGSGKTTLGKELARILKEQGYPVVFLDGDHLREVTGNLFGHDREQRLQASLLYGRLCHFLSSQSINVVCATISLFHETQNWNRKHIPNYVEIFIDVPFSEIIQRDPKKIYSRAQQGDLKNIVGIDIAPEFPQRPELVIKNHNISVQEAVAEIMDFIKCNLCETEEYS